LTTKTGIVGSAGLLERKCVMKQAHKFDTKNDQNSSQQQKLIKNHQNQKIMKSEKTRKSEKVTKTRKRKNTKMHKMEKLKTEK